MNAVEYELHPMYAQSLIYARELREARRRERAMTRQLALYATDLRRMYQSERAPVVQRRIVSERIAEIIAQAEWNVFLQPIVDLVLGAPVGFESLARFSPDLGASPDIVFGLADEVDLGSALEVAVASSALERVPEVAESCYVSINLSPASITSPLFAPAFDACNPRRTVIEITEHVPIDDYGLLGVTLSGFREAGGRIAIDDAGAGFASLRHILRLEPDIIKLDISLTHGVDISGAKRALASSLVAFAREMGITIVAEGIETPGQLQALRRLGVACGQGYLLGRPRSIESFPDPATGP